MLRSSGRISKILMATRQTNKEVSCVNSSDRRNCFLGVLVMPLCQDTVLRSEVVRRNFNL